MRTTIIPAQITTVEDKIAGSLNFSQILLLMVPVLWGTFVYAFLPHAMKVDPYKIGIVFVVAIFSIVLAIRVKGKIIAEWLAVLIRFNLRPKLTLADKNNLTERTIDIPVENARIDVKTKTVTTKKARGNELSVKDLIRLEEAMSSKNLAVSFRYKKKG